MINSKLKGNRGEVLVLQELRNQGMIGEIIETKMRITRIGGRIVMVADSGNKLGDIFGLMGGKAVLVEVKTVERLTYSILADHQHETLRAWAEAGGTALLGWVCGSIVRIIPYPLEWKKGEHVPY